MRRMFVLAVLTAAVLAVVVEASQAQIYFGRGGAGVRSPYFSMGSGSRYYGSPYYGSGWYGNSYYNPGYGSWYPYGNRYPLYGYRTYGTPYYGYYGPTYSGTNYAPTYFSSPSYLSSGVQLSSASSVQPASYQSFYPGSGQNNQAMVRVNVPDRSARVWIDDHLTQQTGTDRLFISPPLEQGKKYSYTVRASWMDNGREVKREKTVPVEPGQTASVSFMDARDETINPPRDQGRPGTTSPDRDNQPVPPR